MTLAAGDVLEITCKLSFNNVSAIRNVYHVRSNDVETATDAAIVDDIAEYMSLMYAEIEGLISNNVTAETVQVVNLTADRDMGEVPWTLDFAGGTATSDTYALGVAAVLRLLTGYRGHQGRKFLGALAEGLIGDDALFVSSALLMLASFAAMLLQPIEILDSLLYFSVYDRIHGVARQITEVVINSVPGYQRRRKQGRGI